MKIIANYRERSRANRASMPTKLCDYASHGSESERKAKVWWSQANTAAKRLRMRQVEHFRSLFQSHFPVRSSLPRAFEFILCAACGSVVLLHAARVFDYFVVIEIAFMDNQAQITETISRLDSEKVSW